MIFDESNAGPFMLHMIRIAEKIIAEKVDVREIVVDVTPLDKDSLTERAIITDDPQLAALQVMKYYTGKSLIEIRNMLDEAIRNESAGEQEPNGKAT